MVLAVLVAQMEKLFAYEALNKETDILEVLKSIRMFHIALSYLLSFEDLTMLKKKIAKTKVEADTESPKDISTNTA